MNRYLRYGLIVIALVTVLLLGLIIYFAAIFNPNAYKPLIINLVKEKKQRELRLNGDISLRLFPSLNIELGPLTLSERNSNVEFASAERVLVSLALLPLLRKQLDLEAIIIEDLKANLIRSRDGSINIADLIAKSEEPEQFKLDVTRVAVEKATLIFHDEASGRHFAFTEVDLEASRLSSRLGPTATATWRRVKSSFTVRQPEEIELDLATTLEFDLTFDVDNQYYAADGISLKSKGILLGINQFVLNCTSDFSARAAELVASNVAINISAASGQSNLDIELQAPRLSLTDHKLLNSDEVSLTAKMSDPQAQVRSQFFLSGMEGNAGDLRSPALLVKLDVIKDDWTIRAMLQSPMVSSFTTGQVNLRDIKGDLRAQGPSLANPGIEGTLLGNASIDVRSRSVQADFTGKFTDSNIEAKLQASALERPGLNFDASVDRLNLDRLLPPEQREGENSKTAGHSNSNAWEQYLDLSHWVA